jgi:hypothetical protein
MALRGVGIVSLSSLDRNKCIRLRSWLVICNCYHMGTFTKRPDILPRSERPASVIGRPWPHRAGVARLAASDLVRPWAVAFDHRRMRAVRSTATRPTSGLGDQPGCSTAVDSIGRPLRCILILPGSDVRPEQEALQRALWRVSSGRGRTSSRSYSRNVYTLKFLS